MNGQNRYEFSGMPGASLQAGVNSIDFRPRSVCMAPMSINVHRVFVAVAKASRR